MLTCCASGMSQQLVFTAMEDATDELDGEDVLVRNGEESTASQQFCPW